MISKACGNRHKLNLVLTRTFSYKFGTERVKLFCLLVLYVPVNNLSVMSGKFPVFLG